MTRDTEEEYMMTKIRDSRIFSCEERNVQYESKKLLANLLRTYYICKSLWCHQSYVQVTSNFHVAFLVKGKLRSELTFQLLSSNFALLKVRLTLLQSVHTLLVSSFLTHTVCMAP